MAPPRASTRKQKEADYSNVGVTGRKTGVTLRDTGVRDEHGLEPIDGIFSSPERPEAPQQTNGNVTLTEEEMEIEHTSSIAEPTDILSTRRPQMPPPRSRSPIKTSLGSSPRRSIGNPFSPARLSDGSRLPTAPQSSSPMSNTPQGEITDSIAQVSDGTHPSPSDGVVARKRGRKPKNIANRGLKRAFETNVKNQQDAVDVEQGPMVAISMLRSGTPSVALEELETQETTHQAIGTQTKSGTAIIPTTGDKATGLQVPKERAKGKRGRPKKQPQPSQGIDGTDIASSRVLKSQGARETRTKDTDVFREPETEVEEGPSKPAKRAKVTTARDSLISKNKPLPSERHPDAMVKSRAGKGKVAPPHIRDKQPLPSPSPPPTLQQQDDGDDQEGKRSTPIRPIAGQKSKLKRSTEASTQFSGRPRPRGLASQQRSETPQDIAQFTKSGRTSVKPCAFWRNERVVYGESRTDGQRISLPGIKEVIRTEEVEISRPQTTRRKGRKRKVESMSEGEGDETLEKWEKNPGQLIGEVMAWDSQEGRAAENELEQIELAVAPKGFEELVKEVKNQKFRYAKTVALPFFHSGMVELPPGGQKRVRNSRRNHMVFWVFSGRVKVEINGAHFGIGRGGMWQVPRGNLYGLENPYEHTARIFFAQGSYMTEAEVDFANETGSVDVEGPDGSRAT